MTASKTPTSLPSGEADPSIGLSPNLVRLILTSQRPAAVNLWNCLTAGEREAAAQTYIETMAIGRTILCRVVASAQNFRENSVRKWSVAKLIAAMRTVPLRDRNIALNLLQHYHVPGQIPMVAAFLDTLEVSHEAGNAKSIRSIDASVDVVRSAASKIAGRYSVRAAVLYLLVLEACGAPAGDKARSWLRKLCQPPAESDPELQAPDAESDALNEPTTVATPDEADPSRQNSFTTLDRLLIFSAVDTAQGIEGALTEDELDDAVDEVVQLNRDRHRSYFHVGYRDVLFDRSIEEELPAQNRTRLRWYWTGAIQGWARRGLWDRIVAQYESNKVIRELGDGTDSASEAAVRHVVHALRHQHRSAEIAQYVGGRALVKDPRLYPTLLKAATELLRKNDAAGARPILELLVKHSPAMEQKGIPPNDPVLLRAQRRMAHCLRQTHDYQRARDLLEDLLRREPSDNVQSMVHADIGLIEGAFNELEDVRLPRRKEELGRVLDQLENGIEHYNRSVEMKTTYSAHGHYCLGVLALGRAVTDGRFEDAEFHLQRSRVHFSEYGAEYPQQLVDRANLYFGIAKAQQLLSHKLEHAADVMVKALGPNIHFPAYLIRKTIDAFDVGDSNADLSRVAAAILDGGGENAVDELSRCDAAREHCRPLADMLYRRGRSQRPSEERASYLRSALDGYMKGRSYEEATEVLDGLDGLANQGFGVTKFLELLRDDNCFEPAWGVTEAAIASARCLEARGEYESAVIALRGMVHRCLSRDTEEGLDDAEGILGRMRTYPEVDPSSFSDLTDRYDAVAERLGESQFDPTESAGRPVTALRILVVGGNERQARAEDSIRSRLSESHPHIAVTFKQSGWGANWKRVFEEIEREFEGHDALVIIRFMRTHLGRRIRQRWPDTRPWRSCWGGGAGAICEAVLRAADAVQ